MPKLKDYHIKSFEDLQSVRAETQLFSHMAGDCYKGLNERLHLEDPEWNSIFWYQVKFSTNTTSVYYCPSANSSLPKSPCVVIVYRGTDFEADYNTKSGNKFDKLFQMVTDKMGDFYADMQIFMGTAATADCFESAKTHAEMFMRDTFDHVPYFYFTGHSLGGAIAMNSVEAVWTDKVVKGVVFNPGVGPDGNYFYEVDYLLNNTPGKRKSVSSNPVPVDQRKTKLESHLIHGTSGLLKNDPVSRFVGGLGTTYHYEGTGIPNGLQGHTVRMFPNQDVHGVMSLETQIPTTH